MTEKFFGSKQKPLLVEYTLHLERPISALEDTAQCFKLYYSSSNLSLHSPTKYILLEQIYSNFISQNS